jgi:glycosyltransferase involved in cell wall biosynthesis
VTPTAARRGTVLVVLHEDVPGGASLSIVRVAPLLAERGWRLVFWASRPSRLYDELRDRGLEVHGDARLIAYSWRALRVPPGPRTRIASQPRYLRAFRATLRRVSPAIVHANSLFTLAEALAARAAGLPVVYHVHEMVPESWKGTVARRVGFWTSREVIAVSEASADRLALPGRRPRIVLEAAPIPPEAPSRVGREGPTVVGTVGVISRRKGSDVFIDAARLVREAAPEVELRMVGAPTDVLDAEWAQRELARAAELGITHVPRADVYRELRDWDIFALPSRVDPFPISVLEALGAALPVVGTAVDGLREQVTPDTGVLIPPEDPKALAEAILELHRDSERRAKLGAAGRRRVLESFTLERQAAGLDEAYRAALRPRR